MDTALDRNDQSMAQFRNILNLLSASSEDYFFLWDITSEQVYFTENVRPKYALLDKGDCCSFKEWSSIVCPQDLPALLEDLKEIRNGKKDDHDMVYRVLNRSGEIVWINCRALLPGRFRHPPVDGGPDL